MNKKKKSLLTIYLFLKLIYSKIIRRRNGYWPKVYNKAEDLPPIEKSPWENSNWLDHVSERLTSRGKEAHARVFDKDTLILLTSILLIHKNFPNRSVSIVDIGGGVGIQFQSLFPSLKLLGISARYNIVDNLHLRDRALKYNDELLSVEYYKDVGEIESTDHPVIVYLSSTLQYILEWRSFLYSLMTMDPAVICIARHPTPDLATKTGYVVQDIRTPKGYCGQASVALIPAALLISTMEEFGYDLISNQGDPGDMNYFWENGCLDLKYFRQTSRVFMFARNCQKQDVVLVN